MIAELKLFLKAFRVTRGAETDLFACTIPMNRRSSTLEV